MRDYQPVDRFSAPLDPRRCQYHVFDPGLDVRGHQCWRKPVETLGGERKYCRQHLRKVYPERPHGDSVEA